MDIPLLFGPYSSAALVQSDKLAAYDANACWFHMFDERAFETCAQLAPAIDVFAPLIYGVKSGRPSMWGRAFLEGASACVPRDRKVQLILDVLDGPASLVETAASSQPSRGLQIFGGASVFADVAVAQGFQTAVAHIRGNAAGAMPVEEAST